MIEFFSVNLQTYRVQSATLLTVDTFGIMYRKLAILKSLTTLQPCSTQPLIL